MGNWANTNTEYRSCKVMCYAGVLVFHELVNSFNYLSSSVVLELNLEKSYRTLSILINKIETRYFDIKYLGGGHDISFTVQNIFANIRNSFRENKSIKGCFCL